MTELRIFYFRGNELVGGEAFERGDLLDAIDHALEATPDYRAEIWADGARFGEVARPPLPSGPDAT